MFSYTDRITSRVALAIDWGDGAIFLITVLWTTYSSSELIQDRNMKKQRSKKDVVPNEESLDFDAYNMNSNLLF